VKLGQKIDGKSLTPVLKDPAADVHPFIVGYFQDSQRMIREGDWKLIWYPKLDRRQLFSVKHDPHELHDRIRDAAVQDLIHNLDKKLMHWLSDCGDPLVAPPPSPAGK
jgi:choline-sulfatase